MSQAGNDNQPNLFPETNTNQRNMHHRVKATAPPASETVRLDCGTIRPTHQDRASLTETGPDHVDSSNHHTNA